MNRENRLFLPILLLVILTQIIGDILQGKGVNHYFVFHLYIPLEYVLLCGYYFLIINHKIIRLLIAASAAVFFLFYFFYFLFDNEAFLTRSFSQFVVSSILISLWVIVFFTEQFLKEEKVYLLKESAFWINTGNLLFYSGCLFVMGFYFYLEKKDHVLANKLLYINYILNLILYTLYIVAFLCRTKKRIY